MPIPSAWRRTALTAALSLCQATTPAWADAFDDMRDKWQLRAAGGAQLDRNDPDIAAQLRLDDAHARRYWSSMQTGPARDALWPDLASTTVSADITAAYRRLAAMAAAYASPHSALHGDAALGAAVVDGLDWMSRQRYVTGRHGYDNWWDWQIGGPMALGNAVMAVRALLQPALLERCLAAIDFHVPDPTLRTRHDGVLSAIMETGANRLDKALITIVRGVNGKSAEHIARGRDAIGQVLPDVTSGDGFYADGSFIQHDHVSYVGGYGAVLIADIAWLSYLLDGSPWTVRDVLADVPFNWVMRAFRPFIYDGAMMDMQRGRSISRQFFSDHGVGRSVAGSIAELAEVLPPAQRAQVKAMLKGWVLRDRSFGASNAAYFTPQPTATPGVSAGLPLYQLALLKDLQRDAAVAPLAEAVETRFYPATDRAVQRRPGHAFALAMFSRRISAFESGNGENLHGWWTGIGMHFLYNADQTQYSGAYWPTVDLYRLAGTTTDRSGASLATPTPWKRYGNTEAAVGGVQLGARHAVAAMDFSTDGVTGSGLRGRKAWFLFGDRVVAVGSDLRGGSAAVETIVENRQLNAAGDNALTVNGARQPTTAGWSQTLEAVRWAHLAGSVPGADIGYVFPDVPAIDALRETRSGAWRDINTEGHATPVSASYLSLALPHGARPGAATGSTASASASASASISGGFSGDSYAYILLPNRSAAQVAAFANANPVRVAERSTGATAVTDRALGLAGVVFWDDAARTVHLAGRPYLASDRKAAVLVQQSRAGLALAVADPTQTNSGVIHLELHRAARAVLSHDPAITVRQLRPTIKMTVKVQGSAGRSYHVKFAMP
ncbi:MAG: polysaccharide lyase 8 family protein [Burkholderiaceae bacterium]|nr:polysaccharide lyase 8 family protein [Burkholderiaceae bacterium]